MPGLIAAENLARDSSVLEKAEDLLKLADQVRRDRAVLDQKVQRYFAIWLCQREHAGYAGRYRGFIPFGRTVIEKWVKRLRQLTFPETEWFGVSARRHASEERVNAMRGLQEYFLTRQMATEQSASTYFRQLVTYGTSPVRHTWRIDEREQTILREKLDEEGHVIAGRFEQAVEKIRDFDGPTFKVVDFFRHYVWPETSPTVDDADLAFEDMLLSRYEVMQRFEQPLVPGKEKKYGNVFENEKAFREYLATIDKEEGTASGDNAQQKFREEAVRLAKMGFQHVIDQQIPKMNRPLDPTEYMWRADLGDGRKMYLVTTVGPVIVRIQENPLWHGRSLWLGGRFVKVSGEYYGHGLPEVFDKMQYFINDMADQAADALVWATTPIALIDLAGVQDPDSFRLAPGAKWFAAKGSVELADPPQGAANAGFMGLSAMMGIANESANPSPLGAMGTAQRGRSRSQQTASGMAILTQEGSVDIGEVVSENEADVFTPILYRNHLLAQQFMTRDVVLRVAGADGISFVERQITVADLVGDFDFHWLASTAQKNAEIRGSQMVNWMMMATKIPPDQLAAENRRIAWAWLLEQSWTIGFGLRDGERVVVPIEKEDVSDWRLENDLFRANRGSEVKVGPKEPHEEHLQGHDRVMQDANVSDIVKREVAAHMADHLQQHMKAQIQGIMKALNPPGADAGAGGMPGGPPGMPPPPENGNGNGVRPPPPAGPGRMAQTGSMGDLFRQAPRGGAVS